MARTGKESKAKQKKAERKAMEKKMNAGFANVKLANEQVWLFSKVFKAAISTKMLISLFSKRKTYKALIQEVCMYRLSNITLIISKVFSPRYAQNIFKKLVILQYL